MTSKVDWYGNDVLVKIKNATPLMLEAVAFRIEERTKINIVSNDQVDTGFMVNSVYVSGANSKYGDAKSKAKAQPRVDHRFQKMAPERKPQGDGVIVAVGANYAIYQEVRNSFLFRALEQVQGDIAEVEIEQVGRRLF